MAGQGTAVKRRRLTGPERAAQVLDVAEELLTAKGYDRTSVEDIAQAAGVSRPIVYGHHGSKEGVYLACMERARRRLVDDYRAALVGVSDPRAQLRVTADVWFSLVERDPARWLALFGAEAPFNGELRDQLQATRSRNAPAYVHAVRGWVRPDVSEDQVAATASLIYGAGHSMARWWISNPHVSRAEIVDQYTEFCWHGLGPLLPVTGDHPDPGEA
jgi:AcrR family transcriptional regulator